MDYETTNDLNIGEVFINSSSLGESQIKALDQLLKFQCLRLERKLNSLKLKRKYLSEGKDIHVSLNELISREIVEAAEILSASTDAMIDSDKKQDNEFNKVNESSITKVQNEINRIIDTINSREPSEEKHVQFAESDEEESIIISNDSSDGKDEIPIRKNKRSQTLPNPNDKVNLSGEVQRMLHTQGTCKPCAFVYNKKKKCRNGPSCGFCHHEDHALCTLKRWKKQQKLVSSGSLTSESFSQLFRSNSEVI